MYAAVKRIAFLLLAVTALAMQKGDAPLRIKAFVCEREGKDPCGKRLRQGFEPVRVRLEAYVSRIPNIVDLSYGLVCQDEDEARAHSVVDLSWGPAPVYFVEHRDITAGFCWGAAILYTRDGSTITARSEPIRILARE